MTERLPRRWTEDVVLAWAQRHLPRTFTSREACLAARECGWHWSNGQSIVAALRRFALVDIQQSNIGKRSRFVFTLRDHAESEAEREEDIIEAQILMRIGERPSDPRIDRLREAFSD